MRTRLPSRYLAVGVARRLGRIDLAADQRAGFEDALVAEGRLLVRFLSAGPVRRLSSAWIVRILSAHIRIGSWESFRMPCLASSWTKLSQSFIASSGVTSNAAHTCCSTIC